ncbi:uncharacterized protein F4822DRAFT_8134 [Hypoxylon trugodes]|uniref:uncharacterized protein n=1 Tax=Hypoxylon trugodes TaxID=326681 RepID=UPI00219E4B18|nr:uncharacterized protein F4822DRAFT_8134 [Hypoxylon trugodes]KAI1393307.1 hypothetical protein F4822DRAFT_8134 [Hypoxylon trugodes]
MAPTEKSKATKGTATKKPDILRSVIKQNRASHKYTQPQRSSLRRAIQESLRDSTAAKTNTTPPPTLQQLSSPSTPISPKNISPQRRSLRQVLKESLHDVSSIPTLNTPPSTPSSTLSSVSSKTTPSTISTPTTPSLQTFVPLTPATPSSSTSSTKAPTTTSSPSTTQLRRSGRQSVLRKRGHQDGGKLGRFKEDDSGDEDGNYDDGGGGEDIDGDEREESDDDELAAKADTQGIPTSRKGWYRVRSIITEAQNRDGRLVYLVEWEGLDPRTGIGWPSSWVDSKHVSAAAIREWQSMRDAITGR